MFGSQGGESAGPVANGSGATDGSTARGPFSSPVNEMMSHAFGQPLDGISVSTGRDHETQLMGASAFTKGQHIGLSSRIKQDPSDPHSMEVIAHEVAHALAPTKKPTSLLDRRGDAGEQTAYGAGQVFRHFVDGGMRGQIPRLQPAHGGTALIHRHQIEGPWNINDPAHETMTEESLRRAGLIDKNDTYRSGSAWDYTRGAMWNDDPEGMLFKSNHRPVPLPVDSDYIPDLDSPYSTGAEWYLRFKNYEQQAEKKDPSQTAFGVGDPLLARSHFGDMSALHGMAGQEGEKAEDTKARMMMWAEFTSKVAMGQIPADAKIGDINIPGFEMFSKDKKQQGRSVAEFFGCGPGGGDVKKRAQGSLLHMIQDSYAGGHTDREMVNGQRGAIKGFHAYPRQDHDKHGDDDAFIDDNDAKDPAKRIKNIKGGEEAVEDGAAILKLLNKKDANWDEIQKHLDQKTFALQPGSEKKAADAGEEYKKEPQAEKGFLDKTWDWFKDTAIDTGLGIGNGILDAKDWLRDTGSNAWDDGFGRAKDWVSQTGSDTWSGIKNGFGRAKDWVSQTGSDAWDGIKNGFGRAKDWVSQTGSDTWSGIKNGFGHAKDWVSQTGSDAWGGIKKGFGSASNWLGDTFGGVGEAASEGRLLDYLGSKGKDGLGGIKNGLGDAKDFLKEKGGEAWGGIKNGLGDAKDFLKEKGGEAWGGIKNGLGDAKDFLKEKGGEAWGGIKSGLQSGKKMLSDTSSNAWDGAKSVWQRAKSIF